MKPTLKPLAILMPLLLGMSTKSLFAQQEDDDVRPSPPSIGADIPVTYFGPPPSTVEPELVGPVQLLTSGVVCLLYTSPSPRDATLSRMPSSA